MNHLITGILFALAFTLPARSAGPPSSDAGKEIEALLKRLADADFKVREAAQSELLKRRDAITALRQLLSSNDKDLARRASEILKEFSRQDDRQALEKLQALSKEGAIDRVIELLVQRKDWGGQEDAAWQVLSEFSGKLLDHDQKHFKKTNIEEVLKLRGTQSLAPFRDFLRYKKGGHRQGFLNGGELKLTVMNKVVVARGEQVTGDCELDDSLIACAGPFRTLELTTSAVFANGPVEVGEMRLAVVVCDGEVRVTKALSHCIVIARGPVHCKGARVVSSVIVSGGEVQIPKAVLKENNLIVQENEREPFGLVKWFDPARVGIEVEAVDSGVKVKSADKDKAFAKAGLRPGDILLVVGGAEVKSPEVFRTLLRRKLAEGGEVPLKVRREKDTLEFAVRCQD